MALAWLIDMLLGHAGACIAVGLAGLLAWHLVQLRRLALWRIKGSAHKSLSAGGMWGQVIDAVMRLRKCNRKCMLSAMLIRFRESAAANTTARCRASVYQSGRAPRSGMAQPSCSGTAPAA